MFKVTVTETSTTHEMCKKWQQLRTTELAAQNGLSDTYGYVESVLPVTRERTVLQAEVSELDLDRVVAAVYRLRPPAEVDKTRLLPIDHL